MHTKVKSQKSKVKSTSQKFEGRTFDFLVVVLTFAFLLLTFPLVAWSCPACKEALFDPGQLAQKLATAKGYALSIGLLLSVPFLLVAGVTMLVVRAAHRKRLVDTPRRWR